MSAIRAMEASKAVVRYVRFTSTPAVSFAHIAVIARQPTERPTAETRPSSVGLGDLALARSLSAYNQWI